MADGPGQQDHDLRPIQHNDTTDSETDSLTFPQISLDTSFHSLLNNSYVSNCASERTMRSAPAQRPPPSLSESWASLSDHEVPRDDDLQSENTDVSSIVDIRSADDVLSVQEEAATSEEEDESDDGNEALPISEPSEAPYAPHLEQSDQLPAAGTSLTETSLLPKHLTLDEFATSDGDEVYVRHVVKHFTRAESQSLNVGKAEQSPGVVGTIRMGLSTLSLKDYGRQTLRLMILGKDHLPSLRSSIVGKVADALVASNSVIDTSRSSSPSRYHVVPDCFGPGSVPSAAEVIPIDCQLEVDSFQSVEFIDSGHHIIQLRDALSAKTVTSIRRNDEYVIDGDESCQPDMAVIVVNGDRADADLEEALPMIAFARRHSIPFLVVSVDGSWSADTLLLPHTIPGVHRCIERDDPEYTENYCRLPLDLDTFLQLDPAQLSRHLADIVRNSHKREDKGLAQAQQTASKDGFGIEWSKLTAGLLSTQQMKALWSHVLLWLIVGFGFILIWQVFFVFTKHEVNMRHEPVNLPVSANITAKCNTSPILTQTSRQVLSASETVPVAQVPRLTIDAAKSDADSFEAEVVGSSHLIIRTPVRLKYKKILAITVLKDGKLLNASATQLFPFVYKVYVPEEEMYGNITVQLAMTNTPSIDTVTIDLGKRPHYVWLRSALDKADAKLTEIIVWFQENQDKIRRRGGYHRTESNTDTLRTAVMKGFAKGEELLQPLMAKIHQLESRIQKWNKHMDVRGAEMFSSAKTKVADVFARGMEQVNQMKETRLPEVSSPWLPRLSSVLLLSDAVDALRNAVTKFGIGQRIQQASHSLQEGTQSETLATAQDRAQHLVKLWRRGQDDRRGRHSA
jgi:hypothetical protein